MSFENPDFSAIQEQLERQDARFDSNEHGNIESWELDPRRITSALKTQYENMQLFLNDPEINETNKEQLLALQKQLDAFIIEITEGFRRNSQDSFEELARMLNRHWGIMTENLEETPFDVNAYLEQEVFPNFDFQTISSQTPTVWEAIVESEEVRVHGWDEIASVIMQIYMKNPDLVHPWDIIAIPKDYFNNAQTLQDVIAIMREQDMIPLPDPAPHSSPHPEVFDNSESPETQDAETIPLPDHNFPKDNDIDITGIEPNTLPADAIKFDEYGNLIIDFDMLQGIELTEELRWLLREYLERMYQDYSENEIDEMFWDAETQDERLDYLESLIYEQSAQIESFTVLYEFMTNDEGFEFQRAKNEYVNRAAGEDNIVKRVFSFQTESGLQESYEHLNTKQELISTLLQTLQQGLQNNFWYDAAPTHQQIQKYIWDAANAWWWDRDILDTFLDENNIVELSYRLSRPWLSEKDYSDVKFTFVNAMSNTLRSRAAFFQNTIGSIPQDKLEWVLPDWFLDTVKQGFNTIPKSRRPNYDTFLQGRIMNYFESMEDNSKRNSIRISNFVVRETLTPRQDTLASLHESAMNHLETNSRLEDYNQTAQETLWARMQNMFQQHGLGNVAQEILDASEKCLEQTIIKQQGRILWSLWGRNPRDILPEIVGEVIHPIEEILTSIEREEQIIGLWLSDTQVNNIKKMSIAWYYDKQFIQNALPTIAEQYTKIWRSEAEIKTQLLSELFPHQSPWDPEYDLFQTYIDINDPFGESWNFADSSIESAVNGAVMVALMIASAGAWTAVSGALLASRWTIAARSMGITAEAATFNSGRLGYIGASTWDISASDIRTSWQFGLGRLFALARVSNLRGWLMVQKAWEAGVYSAAYNGNPLKVLAAMSGIRRVQGAYINGATTGPLVNYR